MVGRTLRGRSVAVARWPHLESVETQRCLLAAPDTWTWWPDTRSPAPPHPDRRGAGFLLGRRRVPGRLSAAPVTSERLQRRLHPDEPERSGKPAAAPPARGF